MDSSTGVLLISLLIRVVLGAIGAAIAYNKNRSAVGWFFGGFFLGLIGIIIVAVLKDPTEDERFREEAERENRRLREQLQQEKIKNETFRQHTFNRLDAHDAKLGMDTKQLSLDDNSNQNGGYLPE